MTFVGFAILVLLVLILIWIYVKLAALPGQIATDRGHPQAEAISVLGWIGLLLGIAPWLVALVWAYTVTGDSALPQKGAGDAVAESS